MFGYDSNDMRQIAVSALMTILFSASCLVAAAAPVRAEQPRSDTASVFVAAAVPAGVARY